MSAIKVQKARGGAGGGEHVFMVLILLIIEHIFLE